MFFFPSKKKARNNGGLIQFELHEPAHGRHSRLRRPLHKADVFRTDLGLVVDLTSLEALKTLELLLAGILQLSLVVHHDLREIHRFCWIGSPHHPYEHQELLSERHWRRSLSKDC